MQPTPASDSSSEDESFARFASVAVSSAQLEQQAEASRQAAQQRQARARQRRAGGGGVLGAAPGDSSGDEDDGGAFLDAAQLKVAEALQRRLQAELEMEEAGPAAAPLPAADQRQQQPAALAQAGEQADEPSVGVRLFRRVKPGAPIVDPQQQQQQAQQRKEARHKNGNNEAAGGGEGGGPRRVTELQHLEEPTKARCRAAAVEPGDIERGAQAAAQQAAQHVASRLNWLPADDDPSRLSHRRKRRAAKLAAEAAAWRQKRAAAA
ncbi:hypothetical protein ABPG75_001176 [Micractinium tetrahymenae]